MAKRRANGEGNLRKRKDGRWEGRYTAGRRPGDGEGHLPECAGQDPGGGQSEAEAAIETAKASTP